MGFKSFFDVNEKIILVIVLGMILSGVVFIVGLFVEFSIICEILF